MHITLLGTGSAMPVPDRVQTGLLLERDDRTLLVDCGAGVLHRLANTDVGYEGVSSVLLTHHHLDHVNDLLALLKARWLAGEDHLEVVGPTGTKALLDSLIADFDYLEGRVDLSVREVSPGESFSVAGFDVESHETVHSVECLAYRFEGEEGEGTFTFGADGEASAAIAPRLLVPRRGGRGQPSDAEPVGRGAGWRRHRPALPDAPVSAHGRETRGDAGQHHRRGVRGRGRGCG
jgi:ribonuclease BN (tRNA processing enzyme)